MEGLSSSGRLAQMKNKYWGTVAKNYEEGRENSYHWRREQKVVGQLLEDAGVAEGSRVLDVPVGTGRFFPYYKTLGCCAVGIDASPDMISQAKAKATEIGFDSVELKIGDITDLSLADNSVDVSVCIRLLNWFDLPLFQQALRELRRVSSEYIIAGVRLSSGHRHIGDRVWLEEVLRTGKKGLKSIGRQILEPLWNEGRTTSPSEKDVDGPSLVDHSEDAVRNEFRALNLGVEADPCALTFRSAPHLTQFGAVETLPYRIFLLRC